MPVSSREKIAERLMEQMSDSTALKSLKASYLFVLAPAQDELAHARACAQTALREEVLKAFRVGQQGDRQGRAGCELQAAAAMNELVLDHLRAHKLQYTLAVFQTEAGCKASQRSPERLLQKLGLEKGTRLHAALQGGPHWCRSAAWHNSGC